ncbi:hypothetical protein CVD25_16660 [Bacillus canaveralius]|uniref:Flagellar protein n=1 Tax=Bacillus canaveralius TaxID=1403243 RepID=A0A2N5GMJ6_9BACI|nr:TIGR03826 family flagellar region protein [Bacillus canaveralius]PLR83154.1 hypothetical protein CU635_09735 [Bacillus canaveralius]PLR94072.1 hypothetical protein CVD25_16660 [Bacillus canaveralius]RSK54127.1 hypothetical protein EJA13_05995 [Bacillus canaveralius]
MAELTNCPSCDELFVKSQFRDLCQKCWKEEEQAFEAVYQFVRKRENRAATIYQVVENTGVEEELILKFIKSGRLKVTQFPNLGYPCDKCGTIIRQGKLCGHCAEQLKKQLDIHEYEEERRLEIEKRGKGTYFAAEDNLRRRN